MASRTTVLYLYRSLIRESKKWNSYIFRMYALRKIKYEFRQNQPIKDSEKIEVCYRKGLEALELIKRQTTLGNLYRAEPLVIEVLKEKKKPN